MGKITPETVYARAHLHEFYPNPHATPAKTAQITLDLMNNHTQLVKWRQLGLDTDKLFKKFNTERMRRRQKELVGAAAAAKDDESSDNEDEPVGIEAAFAAATADPEEDMAGLPAAQRVARVFPQEAKSPEQQEVWVQLCPWYWQKREAGVPKIEMSSNSSLYAAMLKSGITPYQWSTWIGQR